MKKAAYLALGVLLMAGCGTNDRDDTSSAGASELESSSTGSCLGVTLDDYEQAPHLEAAAVEVLGPTFLLPEADEGVRARVPGALLVTHRGGFLPGFSRIFGTPEYQVTSRQNEIRATLSFATYEDGSGNGPAKLLFEAMTRARETSTSAAVWRQSSNGVLTCSKLSNVERYECRVSFVGDPALPQNFRVRVTNTCAETLLAN